MREIERESAGVCVYVCMRARDCEKERIVMRKDLPPHAIDAYINLLVAVRNLCFSCAIRMHTNISTSFLSLLSYLLYFIRFCSSVTKCDIYG